MKKRILFLWSISLFYSIQAIAQYEGSNGDGFDKESATSITLTNLSLGILYDGSNGDGFSSRLLPATTLDNTQLTVLYEGSNGDGFDKQILSATTLDNTQLVVLYDGSNGDGFSSKQLSAITLENTPLAVLYNGSNGDGYTNSLLTATTLDNISLAVLYEGSNGDGFNVSALNATTINNIALTVLYSGGNGDGFSLDQEIVYLDPNQLVDLLLNMKVILQGPSLSPDISNLMNDDLRSNAYIPSVSPYSDALLIDPNVLNTGGITGKGSPNDDIVDWVWVEIRNSNDYTNVINSRSALLQRDGDIVDLDGLSNITIEGLTNSYFIVINHRNHLGIMSNNPISLSSSLTTLNFADNSTPTFGNNAQVQLNNGNMALWAGDANNDNSIRFSGSNNDANNIKDLILLDPLNFLNLLTFSSPGYFTDDVNMDGNTKFSGVNNDSNIIKDNVLSYPLNILNLPTFTIQETIPEED